MNLLVLAIASAALGFPGHPVKWPIWAKISLLYFSELIFKIENHDRGYIIS